MRRNDGRGKPSKAKYFFRIDSEVPEKISLIAGRRSRNQLADVTPSHDYETRLL